jgi:hypothetical protein
MADIRQNAGVKDDFNRDAEDPLSNGGKWAQTDLANDPLVGNSALGQQVARQRNPGLGFSHWTPDPAMDNDDAECWVGLVGYPLLGSAQGVGLVKDTGGTGAADGYLFDIATASGTDSYRLWRFTNWSYTSIGTLSENSAAGTILLIRRNGNDVEGWADTSGVGDSFALKIAVTDMNYTTGLLPMLYCQYTSVDIGLDNFGSGPAEEFIPQIYRRVYG